MKKTTKIFTIFALSIFVSACASPECDDKKSENFSAINACSFNMLYYVDDALWEKRRDFIPELLRFHEFDIIGTQELATPQVEYLLERASEYDFIINQPPEKDGLRPSGRKNWAMNNVTFFRKDRFELLEQGTFWFGPNPYPEEKKTEGWGSDGKEKQNRFCVWGKFKDKKTSKEFYFFNMHWNSRNPGDCLKSAELLISQIKEIAGDNFVVVTGDFNSPRSGKAIGILLESKIIFNSEDISESGHYGPATSAHSYNNNFKRDPIDFVFVSKNIRVLKHATISDTLNGLYPSDHFPVAAKIILK